MVCYSEILNHEKNSIPRICGRLRTWYGEEDWQGSGNIQVLSGYMDTIETRIKNVLGHEIVFKKKVRREIWDLYIEISQSVR